MEINIGGVSNNDILIFTRHLAVALKSGLTLFEGLDMLHDQAKGKMKSVVGSIIEIVQSGVSLHKALEKYPRYFNPIYTNLVKTGEMSGTLEENLLHLSEQLKKAHELRQKIKSAMMYPTMIFMALIGLGVAVAVFVLPKILPLFESLDVKLPFSTRALIFITKILSTHGPQIAIGSIIFVIVAVFILRRDFIKPITHRILMKIPVLKGIIRDINLERFSRTLGTLLDSGVTLDASLQITIDATYNRVYKHAIAACLPEVQKGNSLSGVLEHYPQIFPILVTRMISMGERTGNLDTTMKYLNEYYESEVDNTMKNLATIIEPVMLIFIGVVVGVVALSILGPIYKITGNIQ